MPQRTIGEARQQLGSLEQAMSSRLLRPLQAELEAKCDEAHQMATRQMTESATHGHALVEAAVETFASIRSDLATLVHEGEAGRISARAFNERLGAVRHAQREAERRLAEGSRVAERLASIETDPLAWADDFYARFPPVRPTFSF
jgi:hypothetical protein